MEKQEKLDKIIFYVVIVIEILMILLQNGASCIIKNVDVEN